jgi:hypothetical protein
MKPYRVSILTAGEGSRFGDRSKYSHKALFRVGQKAVISYLIDLFEDDVEFVIALGHNGQLITQYLDMFHPKTRFVYVRTGRYGTGYGPAHTLSECRAELHQPFYSFSCDTIVDGFVADERSNWVGYSEIPRCYSSDYCTLELDGTNSKVNAYFDKQTIGTDKAWIGLAFIKDYAKFWEAMDANNELVNGEKQLSFALFSLDDVRAKRLPGWYDTGSAEGLRLAREHFKGLDGLDKPGEEIYFHDDYVVKYFYNPLMVKGRVERAALLGELVPDVVASSVNFYKYTFVPGEDFFRLADPNTHVPALLDFAQSRLWRDVPLDEAGRARFRNACETFYRRKTESRLRELYNNLTIEDQRCTINGLPVAPLGEIIENAIDWDWLCEGIPSTFHGDFNLSNILLTTERSFKLIDYRQDFGGDELCGDRNYDLAKLYHSFLWPHPSAKSGRYCLGRTGDSVIATIEVPEALEASKRIMEDWVVSRSYDLKKIQVLASIVLLNIAPLHERTSEDQTLPRSDEHLYFLGRYNLSRFLDDQRHLQGQ